MTHPHAIVHIEISAKDRGAMKKFYGDVFGWEFTDYDEMNYTTFAAEGGAPGGFNPVTDENPAGTITPYINTPDIADTIQKIKAAGGEVLMEPMAIPTVGDFVMFKDPSGNLMALLQPLPMQG
ncbi:MAG: VOC family protein [Chloroflexi bacterium]|nr:VOC family protein [Chloroflexota bacterium]